mmetsp:Transcript_108894/g.318660  ORF Transcript_108894/g.318660 Transcript_108894/m.318660 type:complete len:335 (-) Transcript_108894:149-1153(-)
MQRVRMAVPEQAEVPVLGRVSAQGLERRPPGGHSEPRLARGVKAPLLEAVARRLEALHGPAGGRALRAAVGHATEVQVQPGARRLEDEPAVRAHVSRVLAHGGAELQPLAQHLLLALPDAEYPSGTGRLPDELVQPADGAVGGDGLIAALHIDRRRRCEEVLDAQVAIEHVGIDHGLPAVLQSQRLAVLRRAVLQREPGVGELRREDVAVLAPDEAPVQLLVPRLRRALAPQAAPEAPPAVFRIALRAAAPGLLADVQCPVLPKAQCRVRPVALVRHVAAHGRCKVCGLRKLRQGGPSDGPACSAAAAGQGPEPGRGQGAQAPDRGAEGAESKS